MTRMRLAGAKGAPSALLSIFIAVCVLLALSTNLLAQTGTGTVSGTVRDVNQGVVPDAAVTIVNTDTHVAHQAQTSHVGIYYFGALPRGPYRVEVEKTGFKKWEGTLVLEVGQDAVVDAVLQVGSVQNVVQVTGAAPIISTQSAEVADIKDYSRIRQLPLNGRQVSQLFFLTPGIEGDAGNAGSDGNEHSASPRVNGMKVGSLEITMDGVSEVDRFGGGFVRVQPGLESVQEFRIETVGSDARSSRPSTVTLATRSGTNSFHGTVYDFHRNNSAGLRARRREETGNPSQLIRNEFSGSAGGPVYIPHVYDGRNKHFWFADFEGLRDHESALPLQPWVPTEAMWNGDLSGLQDSQGNKITVYDPLTTDANGNRLPFLNNTIPTERISDISKTLHTLTAAPTNSNNPYLAPNFIKFYPNVTSNNNLTIKTDHHLTDKDSLSVRFTRSTQHAAVEGGYFANPIDTSSGMGTSRRDYRIYNASVNYTRSISNSMLNELLVGLERTNADYGTLADFTDWPSRLGLPNPFSVTGWPTIYTCSWDCSSYFGWDSDNRHNQALTGYVLEDNVTWTRGKHTLQFGGKFRKEGDNVRELQQSQGSHEFDAAWTGLFSSADQALAPLTGDGFAEMLLGLPDYLSNQYNRGYFYFRQNEAGLYVTDKWRVSPRLTLDLGLRWDKWTPYREKQNRLEEADLATALTTFQVITPDNHKMENLPGIPPSVLDAWAQRGLTWTTANAVGYPTGLFAPDNNNFGPRLGVAFKINEKTVLRGGYGEYFWTMPLSLILQSTRNNPPLNLRFVNDPHLRNEDRTFPFITPPVASDFLPAATVDITTGVAPPGAESSTIWDGRNWKDGHARTWHVTLEREFDKNTALHVSYIGTHGQDLEQQFSLNSPESRYNYAVRTGTAAPGNNDVRRPNPDWTFFALNRTGYSNTHSGQIEIERKFATGISFQWFYTYTRSLTTADPNGFDDGNRTLTSVSGGGLVPETSQIYGEPSLSFDQRLRFAYFNSTNIPPHRVRFNALFDLPFGRGKKWGAGVPGVLNQLIGGWQIATIGDWRSGFWLSPSASVYQFGKIRLSPDQRPTLDFGGERQRLWFIGSFDPSLASNVQGGDLTALIPQDPAQRVARLAGPSCPDPDTGQVSYAGSIGVPNVLLADGTIGCFNASASDIYNPSPRANIIGPGAWNTDLSAMKNFKIKERLGIRFTADFFNAFNHPNDRPPNTTTGLQDLTFQNNDPRIIQLSLRLDW